MEGDERTLFENNFVAETWTAVLASVRAGVGSEGYRGERPGFSRADLDSHANMVCLGSHCTVIRRTGKFVRVNAFASAVGSLNDVPLVDAAVVYEDNNGERYLLVFYNALFIPSMKHHLIPPFILREAGLRVNEVPKIQSPDPGEETHSIYSPEWGLRIHLGLHGIFSYFSCRGMTRDEMRNWSDFKVIHATPKGTWNPYDSVFAEEEAGFINAEGGFNDEKLPEERKYHLIDEGEHVLSGLSDVQALYADPISAQQYQEEISRRFAAVSVMLMDEDDSDDREVAALHRRIEGLEYDPIQRGIANVDSTLVEEELADALDELQLATAFGVAAGSISAFDMDDDDLFVDGVGAIIGEATATFSAIASGKPKGVSAEQLSKLWRISHSDAERTIKETTQLGRYSADLRESNAPMILWDYCLERRVQIMNLTARDTHKLRGLNPYTVTMGDQGDISNLCNFGWFEWCYYKEDRTPRFKYPHALDKLGRCLGPSKNEGNEMAQWVLTQTGSIVPRRTLRRLTPHELSVTNETERAKRQTFMEDIRRRLGDAATLPPLGEVVLPTIPEESNEALYNMWLGDGADHSGWVEEGDADFEELLRDAKGGWIPEADIVDAAGKPVSPTSLGDMMIGIEVLLPQGEERAALCKVLRRSVDKDGKTTGIYDKDPSLNTMIYDVEFPDGAVKQYGANIIAQNVLEQVEDDGHYTVKLKQILDHRREGNAVSKEQKYVTMRNGQQKL